MKLVGREETPKKATKLLVTIAGNGTDRIAFFQVLTDEDFPVSNATIRIVGTDNAEGFVEIGKTDESGSISWKFQLSKPKKVFKFSVVGSAVTVRQPVYR